jgi:hypothetical protein
MTKHVPLEAALMKQDWFEMQNIRRRKLATAVWIPLRAVYDFKRAGDYGNPGFLKDFYGVGTLAVPLDKKAEAEKLGWSGVGISHNHAGIAQMTSTFLPMFMRIMTAHCPASTSFSISAGTRASTRNGICIRTS